MKVTKRSSASLRCALCHGELAKKIGWICPGCGAEAHRSCGEELARCPTLGCSERISWRPSSPRRCWPVRTIALVLVGLAVWTVCSLALSDFEAVCVPWRLNWDGPDPALWKSFAKTAFPFLGALVIARLRRDIYG